MAASATASTGAPSGSATEVLAQNSEIHDDQTDYVLESAAVIPIVLSGNSISAGAAGVSVVGTRATITSAGTYGISGSLEDGQIIVDTADGETVRLVLNGVDIRSSTSAPIYVRNAEKAIIILADDTENHLADGESYVFEAADDDEPNAALFSKSDLTIFGNGSLSVDANYNDGVASKDGLIIAGGTITVQSVDDGIRGKDYLVIQDGNIVINAKSDGLKSDNAEDPTKGYISIEKGVFNISSGGDAIDVETDVIIADGEFTLSSGGGSSNYFGADTSAKGIKGTVSVNIDGGAFHIDSADDGLHSNGSLTIDGGTFHIASGDDAMHADATLTINGGEIRIRESFEGLESAVITINAGNLHIVSSDDGINVVSGVDGSGMAQRAGAGGGPGRGQGSFTYSGDYYLYIHGGYIAIEAAGDGIDVNGAIEMTDGIVIINGPTQQMNGALDYDGGFKITGGFLVAVGSAGMGQAPDESSSQYSMLVNLNSTVRARTLVHIQDSAGNDVLTFAPSKQYQSIALSSPQLAKGATYSLYLGGNSTGTANDGLYQGGNYTPGTEYASFTISGMVTRLGSSRSRF